MFSMAAAGGKIKPGSEDDSSRTLPWSALRLICKRRAPSFYGRIVSAKNRFPLFGTMP